MKYTQLDNELKCNEYCLKLEDGTKIYRYLCDKCIDCDESQYEVEYCTDEFGKKITCPELSGATSCDESLTKEKVCIQLYDVNYNNDSRGCGITSHIWSTAAGGNPAIYTNWEWEVDGANVISAADSTFTVTASGGAGWNQNFTLTIPVMNTSNPFGHTWEWFNAGKPCYRFWSILGCDPNLLKYGLMTVTITRGSVVKDVTMFPEINEFKKVVFWRCTSCSEDGTVKYFDGSNTEITDMYAYIAEISGVGLAKLLQYFPTEDDLIKCISECQDVNPELPESPLECETYITELCDVVDTNTTNTFFRSATVCVLDGTTTSIDIVDTVEDPRTTDPDVITDYVVTGELGACGTETSSTILCDSCGNNIEVVTYDDGTILYYTYSEKGGRGELTFPIGDLGKCGEDCGSFTTNCMCYGAEDSSGFNYALNEGDATEGSFSSNPTTIKWQTSGALTASIPVIDDCITNGGKATITATDQDGNVLVFVADGFLNPAGTSPSTAYSGTGIGGFSGKIRSVVITCSSSTGSGKACQWISCDKLTEKWFDGTTELTPEQIETLVECPISIEPDCDVTDIQLIACSTEDNVEVNIDDQILTLAKQDCNDVIVSSTQYNVTQGNAELTLPVNTTSCDPDPNIVPLEECFVDSDGVQWTHVYVLDPVDNSIISEIFYNQNLNIGVPAGDIKDRKPCPNASGLQDIEKVCFEWFGDVYKGYAFVYSDGEIQLGTSLDSSSTIVGAATFCCDDCIQVFGCRDGRLAFPIGSEVVMSNGDVINITGLRSGEVADLITDTYGGTNLTPSLGDAATAPNFSQCQGSSQHELQFYNLPVDIVSISEMDSYGKFGDCTSKDICLTECTSDMVSGYDITDTLFRCSKIGFVIDNAFTSLCPDGWTPQQLVDTLNANNPTGTIFEVVSGNIIGVVSGEAPELIQFFHSGGGSTTVIPSVSGDATLCATRVKDCNSDKQTELLQEIADNTCPSSVSSNVICASTAQSVVLVDNTTVNLIAGQELLVGEVYDCKGNLQSFSISVLINSVLTEISDPVDTGSCPNPAETIPKGCIKDEKGSEWNVFETILNGETVTYFQDSITGMVGTPAGKPETWTGCGEGCISTDRHCFCVVSKGTVKGSTKGKVAKTKTSQSEATGKILSACRIKFYDCGGELVKTEYEINGKTLSEDTWNNYNFSIVPCDSQDVTYSPAAVTCAVEDRVIDVNNVQVILNCQVFTNDFDPTDTFTQYTLADDYSTEGLGGIGDVYIPLSEPSVTGCPCEPNCIVEDETCYIAQMSIKGVANTGDSITVVTVQNLQSNVTIYTITHSSSGSLIYTGTDPLGDANIDLNNVAQWVEGDCDEEIDIPSCCPVVVESCACIEGVKTDVQYGVYPDTGQLVGWFRNQATGQLLKEEPTWIDCCEECEFSLCDTNGDGTGSPTCTSTFTCTVFKDLGSKSSVGVSVSTLNNVEIITSICDTFDNTFTGLGVPNNVIQSGYIQNTNLEDWINTNLGAFGFSAIPTTQVIPNTGGSVSPYWMDLTYPTCSPWSFNVMFTSTHYSSGNPPFSGVRYEYSSGTVVVRLLDNLGNIINPSPTYPNAGNVNSGLNLQLC